MAAGMSGLTASELAERCGASEEEIEHLTSLGILVAREGEDGPYLDADVPKVRLATACAGAGLPLDGIGAAIGTGKLSFAFLENAAYQRWATRSSRTYREVAMEVGIDLEFLHRWLEAVGWPPMGSDDRIRADELEVVPLIQSAYATGTMDDAMLIRTGRVYHDALRRIVQAEAEVYHAKLEVPLLASGLSQGQLMDVASQIGQQFPPLLDRALMAGYRRQQELAWTEDMVEHVEAALEEAGIRARPGRVPAMSFLDLAGYTRLTEEQGDEAAAELAASLAGLVARASRDRGGTPVKWLGDGVMCHWKDPGEAVLGVLELVGSVVDAGLPPAHVGVAAGPVVVQGGDYFGRTVNIASRIAGRARAGQVLVNEGVVEAGEPAGVRYVELRPVELKGLAAPVRVFEAVG
jgi:adenylate cyclase